MLISNAQRRLLSEALIATGVCAAVLVGVLMPAERRLAQARAEWSAMRPESEAVSGAVQGLAANTLRLERAAAVHDAWMRDGGMASDIAGLYSSLEALARDHGVRLEQVDPASRGPTQTRRERPDPRVARPGDERVELGMTLSGDLDSITALAHAIETSSSLARITLLEVMPSPQAGTLTAQMRVVYARLDLSPLSPEELATLEGGE